MDLPTGKEGCQCTDKSSLLASLDRWPCLTSDGENGVLLSTEGPCVPSSYGSGGCLRHDWIHDPNCEMTNSDRGINNPDYCLRPWCYVDMTTCRQSSSERVHRSDIFPRQDLFYSYSTCGSSAGDWKQYLQEKPISLSTIVPTYAAPLMYKRSPSGDILTSHGIGAEYYNNR
ncbi:hypothetical protein ACHAXR_006899 [Thalassiosira sp. AJA248-18]